MSKVLIPCNFSGNDEKAVDFVTARYRDHQEVWLTLFHAYQPIPEIDVKDNPIMDKMKGTTSYLRQLLNDKQKELEQMKTHLVSEGFRDKNIDCLFVPARSNLAEDLVRLIRSRGYDTVVFTKHPGNIINYFSRSISKTVSKNLGSGVTVHIIS